MKSSAVPIGILIGMSLSVAFLFLAGFVNPLMLIIFKFIFQCSSENFGCGVIAWIISLAIWPVLGGLVGLMYEKR